MQSTSSGAMAQRPIQSSFQAHAAATSGAASNQPSPNVKVEDHLKTIESEINTQLKKFNDPLTPDDSLEPM
jgi:hypothetical protein